MNLIKLERQLLKLRINYRPASTQTNPEYPEYPPIEDLSFESKQKKRREEWSNAVKNCGTVEEKLMKLNMPRYYGWKCINFNDAKIPYNSLPLIQHCTRTSYVENLPKFYDSINVDTSLESIKSAIEEAILFEHDILRSYEINKIDLTPVEKENRLSKSISKQINRVILNNLPAEHLKDTQVDLDPRHEAFWFVGGINPPENVRKQRESLEWTKHMATDPVDRQAQYLGTPAVAVRTSLPLEPITPYSEAADEKYEVLKFTYEPNTIGFTTHHRHGTNIPGFWPGDKHEFGLLSYQTRGHLVSRPASFGAEDNQEALHAQGILSSFASGLSQAAYQGFTTFNDLTYPLVMQTVITNGQEFSFYTYQLNTTTFYSEYIEENPKKNICWGTKTQKLYEEIKDGKLVGFNTEVLKPLLKFYANVPKAREGDMKPYLDKNESIVAQIQDTEKREWLEPQYKHMVANRPRHLPLYEIYHWEKIYKIDHNTRPLEPKRRPFELNINPWKRKYDERSPSYIPKALRPNGPKSKPKFYKSFYP